MSSLDRRTFLLGVAGTGVLVACSDDSANPTGDDTSTDPADDTTSASTPVGTPALLIPTFPEGVRSPISIVTAGAEQRLTFVLRDEVDTMRDNAPAEIDIQISLNGEVVATGPQQLRSDGIITPYYPVYFTPAEPGEYVATVVDHPDLDPVPFLAVDRAELEIVQVGDPMRPVDTPTVDNARGVDPICTRAVPCDFHAITLTEALDSGKPTVLIISTPGFCQTDICGPVLDLLIDAASSRDDMAIVHAEVYVDPRNPPDGGFLPTTEAVNTYVIPFEPQLLVADADGTIVARLDTMWDRSELDAALALV